MKTLLWGVFVILAILFALPSKSYLARFDRLDEYAMAVIWALLAIACRNK